MKIRCLKNSINLAGFTLLEVLIITAVIILLSSTGISYLDKCREYSLLRMSAQAFCGELNRARAASISCGVPVEVHLGPDSKSSNLRLRYSGACFGDFLLPGHLYFNSHPSKPIIFYGTGTCTPSGTYVIAGEKGRVKVVVSIMGRVRWEFM